MTNSPSSEFKTAAEELAMVGRFFAAKGWSPATSSNYSVRLSSGELALTKSGTDKSLMTAEDILLLSPDGQVVTPEGAKPSAETLIHQTIYKWRAGANGGARAVLHTHSVFGTRLSLKFEHLGQVRMGGYELLKGLRGNTTHETEEVLPVLANAQDMVEFSTRLEPVLQEFPHLHGFLIAGHGLYTWGDNLPEAKRHIETFEFLFECLVYEQLGI